MEIPPINGGGWIYFTSMSIEDFFNKMHKDLGVKEDDPTPINKKKKRKRAPWSMNKKKRK